MVNDKCNDIGDDTIIIHPPSHDPTLLIPSQTINDIKISNGELWSIQDAIVYIFQLRLSKNYTLQKRSIGLDNRFHKNGTKSLLKHSTNLIKYATYDCLSLTQLVLFMYQSKMPSALICVQYSPYSGKYLPCQADIFSDFLKNNSPCFDEHIDNSMIVHDSNEHHKFFPDGNSTTVEQHLTSSNSNIVNNSNVRHKRSITSQKRRNKKSSIRHRRNRYSYEIIRPINLSITSVKHLLRKNHTKYVNINIVKSVLYIGVKNEGYKQLYEQILPSDMFV